MEELKWRRLEEYVQATMTKNHVPGAAIAVSKNGEIVFQKGFGLRDLETKEPVTPETIFGIASVTKSFTGMAIMKLEEAGTLSIEDSVIKYIPELRIAGINNIEDIKIYHLLSHTTGMPPLFRREDLTKLKAHIDYLAGKRLEMLGKPGDYFSYCNDTFLLLGMIIERLSGQLYRRFITQNILEPLKMNRSTFSIEELNKFENVSVPYVFNGKYEKQEWPKLGNYEVGGGIRSSVLDLVKYGHQFIGHSESVQLVLQAQLAKMWKPIYEFDKHSSYGLALKITKNYSGVTLVEHGGEQPGVSSNFGFIPEENLVVSVLTNVSGAPSSDLWLAAVNTALNLPIGQKRTSEIEYKLSEQELLRLVGTYDCEEGTSLTVNMIDGKPKVRIGEDVFDLRAVNKETLVLPFEKTLKFYFNHHDRPWAVLFGSRMLRRVKA